jgi:predicted metalloprotease
MRWRVGRRSTNVEDIRYEEGPRRVPRGIQLGGGGILLVLILSLLTGQNPLQLLGMLNGDAPVSAPHAPRPAGTDEAADFVSVILADTEDTWGAMFSAAGQTYPPPKLVLFSDLVESACGMNSTATGPFYCPGDQKVYLDLGFLRELKQLGVSGDFAVAYVIAHEVGHHVQKVVGAERQFRQLQSQVRSQADANTLSVLMELQADCYAGVWAHHADTQRQLLEEGDIEEGLQAAAAIGDDRLQRMAGRGVNPDAFTHGSSQQRVQWFRTGLQTGSVDACNTFAQREQ